MHGDVHLAYSLNEPVIDRLQRGVAKAGQQLGRYTADTINLDFHAVPHWGDESVLGRTGYCAHKHQGARALRGTASNITLRRPTSAAAR
jgi:hypothetical protein